MLYLSQVLGAPVEDQQNERVGRIVDVLVPVGSEAPPYPSALLVEGEEDLLWRVSPEAVERREGTMHLHVPLTQLTRYVSGSSEHEISLAQEVFDKQVIDI